MNNNAMILELLHNAVMANRANAMGHEDEARKLREASKVAIETEAAKAGIARENVQRYMAVDEEKVIRGMSKAGAIYGTTGIPEVLALVEAMLADMHDWATEAVADQRKLGLADETTGAGIFSHLPQVFTDKAHTDGVLALMKAGLNRYNEGLDKAHALFRKAYKVATTDEELRAVIGLRSLTDHMAEVADVAIALTRARGFRRTAEATMALFDAMERIGEEGNALHEATGTNAVFRFDEDSRVAKDVMKVVVDYVLAHGSDEGFNDAEQIAKLKTSAAKVTPFPAPTPLDRAILAGNEAKVNALLEAKAA